MNRRIARALGIAGYSSMWLVAGVVVFFVPEWASGEDMRVLYWRLAGGVLVAVGVGCLLSSGLRVYLQAQYRGSGGTDEESSASPQDKLEVNILRLGKACRDRARSSGRMEVELTDEGTVEYSETGGQLFALIPARVGGKPVQVEAEGSVMREKMWLACRLVAVFDGRSWDPTGMCLLGNKEDAVTELKKLRVSAADEYREKTSVS